MILKYLNEGVIVKELEFKMIGSRELNILLGLVNTISNVF